ncbi:GWxTD domain-containing protein [Aliifodinibius sp. S!AR15-10]|uniref:GWxTD domain-containing protein n=1 Tax=Aliifodinibius sp. S!AR15-10 TaxID=2950437 RepID=UPI0028674165|nr:GWxTD domain-containing protein [Aliifodinibius sp. S!AR15-10]MDR8394409.1 GWxTD domain-containing protein [Aliifodinibius sp. S!AR15-10]
MMRSILSLLFLAFLSLGCSQSMNPDIVRGSTYQYRGGYPEVRLSAIGLFNEDDEPQINVAADIVYGSLIYKEVNNMQTANIAIEVQILDQENTENIISTERYTMTIEREDPNIAYSQEVLTFEKEMPVSPGDYQINLTVVDQNSGKHTTRTSNTFIPNPDEQISNLTNIRLLGKEVGEHDGAWLPITTYDVQGKIDSLKFVFQVTNNKTDNPLTIDTELIRFESDTSVARPMHYNNYSPSNISYKGIEYDEEEVIQSSRRVLTQAGSVLVEFFFPQQERGNYRFEVTTSEQEGESLFKARDFSVKSTNYPSIKTAEEMLGPLHYLMSEKEYERMTAINDSDSLKSAIDRFWLKNIQNKNKARNVIEMFYSRVEEANKQFSNFKEGWKTDPGMIYILFGPPWYVETHLDVMTWSYAYDRSDPEYNYTFQRSKLKSKFYPFDNYILRRNQGYFNMQYQQIQLWLSGQILTRSI